MALNLISLTHLGNSWNCSNIHIIRKKKSHSMRVGFLFAVSFFLFLKSLYLFVVQIDMVFKVVCDTAKVRFFKQITTKKHLIKPITRCLRYCKSTIFQANHNIATAKCACRPVVCDTAKVRFFKQITTKATKSFVTHKLFAILQKYDFSSKSQLFVNLVLS